MSQEFKNENPENLESEDSGDEIPKLRNSRIARMKILQTEEFGILIFPGSGISSCSHCLLLYIIK